MNDRVSGMGQALSKIETLDIPDSFYTVLSGVNGIMRMIKVTEKILPILVLSMVITGCVSDPKTIAREEASLDRQALFYESEARKY